MSLAHYLKAVFSFAGVAAVTAGVILILMMIVKISDVMERVISPL